MRLLLFGLLGLPFLPLFSRAAPVTATVEESRPLVATGEVIVDNVNGPVTIETWDKPEVRLVATKEARTEADLKALAVRIESTDTRFSVKTEYLDKDGSWLKKFTNTGSVSYTLTVPHTATLRRIETLNGAIQISNAHGRVNAKSLNGGIAARGLRHEIELNTVNGGIVAEFDAIGDKQDVRLETDNGAIELRIPADTSAEIDASALNGGIANDFGLSATEENWVGHALSGRLGTGAGRIRLKTINGSIAIRKR